MKPTLAELRKEFGRCDTCRHGAPNSGCGRFCLKHEQNVGSGDICIEHETTTRAHLRMIRRVNS